MNDRLKDRLFELLADEALVGLSGGEQAELNDLRKQFPEWARDFSHELAAAAIGLSDLRAGEDDAALPADLREKILRGAARFFAADEKGRSDSSATEKSFTSPAQIEQSKSSWFGQWLGWAVAAAACVALAVNLWLTHSSFTQPQISQNQPPNQTPEVIKTIAPPSAELTARQQRERLIADAPDAVKIDLKAAQIKSFENLSGDVVWSNERQKGFVRFRGLPANDARRETYQLWIVDAARDVKTPVSGGVFDVGETGEIIVPVDAQLEIKNPKAFAVTREKPGGVVVSSPERVVASGKI